MLAATFQECLTFFISVAVIAHWMRSRCLPFPEGDGCFLYRTDNM